MLRAALRCASARGTVVSTTKEKKKKALGQHLDRYQCHYVDVNV